MHTLAFTGNGTPVTLQQMLAARERRAARQAAALARFGKPLVSMTVVIPGPVKDNNLSRGVLAEALWEMEVLSDMKGWPVLARQVYWNQTGPEAIFVLDVGAHLLKSATVELEDHHPIGRLWDLDVMAPGQAPLSRQDFGFPPRRCLVCGRSAHVCGRSRRHSLEELLSTIGRIVHDYGLRSAA